MTLHVVLHHRRDPHQPWTNNWVDDDRIESIQTTVEIGRLCEAARARDERVFVHRCAWGSNPPTICCSAKVSQIAAIDRRTTLVRFLEPTGLATPPVVQA